MNEILALNKNWTLSYNGEKIATNVPGDITWDLFTAGKIPDPYFGLNHKDLHWIIATDFEYSTVFDLSQDLLVNQQILLQFDSVDTFADIYLNDRYVGSTKNMFLQYEFDITESVKVSGNKLVVKMLSTKRKMDGIDDTGLLRCIQQQTAVYTQSSMSLRLGLGARHARLRNLRSSASKRRAQKSYG